MSRLVLIVLIAIALAADLISAQFSQQQFPSQQFPAAGGINQRVPQQFGDFPNIEFDCRRPGANCRIDNRFAEEQSVTNDRGQVQRFQKYCDERGCYERKYYNGSTSIATNVILMSSTISLALLARKLMHLF